MDNKRDAIVEAASAALASAGVGRLTVGLVAEATHVSTALVHYHFDTKQQLLAAAAQALAQRRSDARVAALGTGQGLARLDALWAVLADDRATAERAAPDLVLLAREDRDVRTMLRRERQREQARVATALPGLFGSLGTQPRVLAEDLAATVCTFLDGVTVSLLAGVPSRDVRASYDAFWLALVALGQASPAAR